jgi:hypothetical protein
MVASALSSSVPIIFRREGKRRATTPARARLLESYARERDVNVVLERMSGGEEWVCVLRSRSDAAAIRSVGETAREAIMEALREEGVELPQ